MRTFKFQNKRSKNYFEGWYLHLTSNNKNYGIIFAITKSVKDPHAFIQFFSEDYEACKYYRYSLDKFRFENETVHIGDNFLNMDSVFINEDIQVDLKIANHTLLTKNNEVVSAMSYLENMPLDCFQEVLYFKADVTGSIVDTVEEIINGTIYSEKTYGNKFPKKWIWLQSFDNSEAELSFSIGKVPVGPFTINGFFFLLKNEYEILRLSTTNNAKIKINNTADHANIIIKKGRTTVEIDAFMDKPVKLVGPSNGGVMNLDVYESISSTCTVKVNDKVYHFKNCGFENMY